MQTIPRTAIHYGLIGGMAAIAIGLLLYLMNTRGFISYGDWVQLIVFIATLVMAGNAYRSELGGYMNFKQGFSCMFITWAIAGFIYGVFYYLMYNIFDKGLLDLTKEIAVEMIEKMSNLMGEEVAEEAMEKIENEINFSMSSILQKYLMYLLVAAPVSAVIALILRKNPPLNSPSGDDE